MLYPQHAEGNGGAMLCSDSRLCDPRLLNVVISPTHSAFFSLVFSPKPMGWSPRWSRTILVKVAQVKNHQKKHLTITDTLNYAALSQGLMQQGAH